MNNEEYQFDEQTEEENSIFPFGFQTEEDMVNYIQTGMLSHELDIY